MKIKVDITDKEKNILYRLFTLILIIINLIVTYYSSIQLDRIVKQPFLQVIVSTILLYNLIFTSKAILIHYKYPNK